MMYLSVFLCKNELWLSWHLNRSNIENKEERDLSELKFHSSRCGLTASLGYESKNSSEGLAGGMVTKALDSQMAHHSSNSESGDLKFMTGACVPTPQQV